MQIAHTIVGIFATNKPTPAFQAPEVKRMREGQCSVRTTLCVRSHPSRVHVRYRRGMMALREIMIWIIQAVLFGIGIGFAGLTAHLAGPLLAAAFAIDELIPTAIVFFAVTAGAKITMQGPLVVPAGATYFFKGPGTVINTASVTVTMKLVSRRPNKNLNSRSKRSSRRKATVPMFSNPVTTPPSASTYMTAARRGSP